MTPFVRISSDPPRRLLRDSLHKVRTKPFYERLITGVLLRGPSYLSHSKILVNKEIDSNLRINSSKQSLSLNYLLSPLYKQTLIRVYKLILKNTHKLT